MDEQNPTTATPADPAHALYSALVAKDTPPARRAALVGAVIIAADEAGIESAQSLTYPTVLCSFYRTAATIPRAAAAVAFVHELLTAGE